MSDIEVLNEIGLEEISRRTHIEKKTLQYMLNKEFGKLGRINTLGFIKILNREFNLDLKEFQEELEAYWNEKNAQASSKAEAVFAVNAPVAPKKSKLKFLFLFLILLALIGFGVQYFSLWEKAKPAITNLVSQFSSNNQDEPISSQEGVSYTTPSVVNEAQKILENETFTQANESLVIEDLNESESIDALELVDENNQTASNELNQTLESSKEEVISQEEAASQKEETIIAKDVQEPASKVENALFVGDSNSKAVILPNVKIWVGIVYLDNKKRASYLTNEPIELDLTREQIITTGHGNFTLEFDDQKDPYKEEFPKRFYWDGKNLKSISYDEFVELNGGSAW